MPVPDGKASASSSIKDAEARRQTGCYSKHYRRSQGAKVARRHIMLLDLRGKDLQKAALLYCSS